MAHAFSITSSSLASPIFEYSSSLSLLSTRKHILAVFLGSTILMFIVILTMVLCFIDCLHKGAKQNHNISMIKTNSITNHHNTLSSKSGKHSFTLLPMKTKTFYENNGSTNHLKTLIQTTQMRPIIGISSSDSHSSSSSIDSMTRANTAHNRALTNTYTYVALNTSDDLLPVDFDDNANSSIDDNGIEIMMTTV